MPGIVARVGGPPVPPHETEAVLAPLRHFAFYESAAKSCANGWLGWVGIGRAACRLDRDDRSGRVVVYHGDAAERRDDAQRRSRAEDIAALLGKGAAELARRLGGSFAAASFDPASGEFHCATDRFGHHRVYYCQVGPTLYVVCELKALLGWPELPAAPDPDALRDLINYGYPLGDRTSLAGVKLLQPASQLSFCDGVLRVGRYWQPRYEPVEGDDEELAAEGHRLFCESYAAKTAGAARLLVPVSGGLDSRLLLARARAEGQEIFAYTYGHARAREAAVACEVMRALDVPPRHIVTDDFPGAVDAVRRATWFGEGMVNATIAQLAMLLDKFAAEPRSSLYINGIYGGPTNFSNGYHKPNELVPDMPRAEKVARIGATMFSHLLHTAQNYRKLTPAFARDCDQAYDREIDRLLADYEDVSPLFGHQKDAFYIDNRLCRFMNQVDLNRYYWDEVIPLTSTALYDFYLRLPDRVKFGRLLHKQMLARYYPRAAAAPVFSSGISVTDELAGRPALRPGRLQARAGRAREILRRLTLGRYNPPDPGDFRSHDYHYRRNRVLMGFYDSVLGDERLLADAYFDRTVVRRYLRRFRIGVQHAGTLATIMAWELWLRQLNARRWDV
ncbi:MAG: asparagine synthase-related protein [Candidatus Krumholzibacteria bacterium]|nr:asparagine synthase-related protein [Candidatus Krumholzibacteria bacterium]